MATLNRTKENPWQLKTAPGTSEYTMHIEEKDGKSVLACTVGKTVLFYDARCIDDLHKMLKAKADWVELGGTDEQKPAKEGTVEAWGAFSKQSCRWLVRPKEGPSRALRRVRSAPNGGAQPLRT